MGEVDGAAAKAAGLAIIHGYHAHVYYDSGSRDTALHLRRALADAFVVELGRWHDEPVGPHPRSMYQVKFAPADFGRVVPWLMLNRGGLTILVHPETGGDYKDHTDHALWLGDKLELKLDVLRKSGE